MTSDTTPALPRVLVGSNGPGRRLLSTGIFGRWGLRCLGNSLPRAERGLFSPGLPKDRIGPHLNADHGLQRRARQTGLASGDVTPELLDINNGVVGQ